MTAPIISSAEIINNEHIGTAQGGSTTGIILASGASSTDDYYNGCRVDLTNGSGIGNVRFITDYDGTTKVAIVSPAWNSTYSTAPSPSANTEYKTYAGNLLKVTWDQAVTHVGETATVIINDTFTDTDNTDIDAHSPDTDTTTNAVWSDPVQQVHIVSNQARNDGATPGDPDMVAIIDGEIADNFRIEAGFIHSGGSTELGIIINSNSGATDWFTIEFWESDDTIRLARWQGASAGTVTRTQIDSFSGSWTANRFATTTPVRIDVNDGVITIYVDGALQGTFTNTDVGSSTNQYHGFHLTVNASQSCQDWKLSSLTTAKAGTVDSSPLLGSITNRELTIGTPVAGDGTSIHYYNLPAGKPINSGETVNVGFESGFVQNSGSETSITISNQSVTNNSPQTAPPIIQLMPIKTVVTATSLVLEAQAIGVFGSGDGLSQVVFTVDDGVNTPVTSTVTTRSESAVDGLYRFQSNMDLSTLDDGALTITATATSNCGLGTRSDTFGILYNGGGGLSTDTYYVSTTGTGSGGLTEGDALGSIRTAAIAAVTAGLDYATIELIDEGNHVLAGAANTPTVDIPIVIQHKSSLNKANVYLVGDATNSLNCYYMEATDLIIDGPTLFINKSCDPAAAQHDGVYRLNMNGSACRLILTNGGLEGGTAISSETPSFTTIFNASVEVWGVSITTNKISTGAGFTRVFDWTVQNCDGDVLQNAQGGHSITVAARQGGEPAFTVQTSGVGTATIAKGSSTVTLTDDNGTLNIDLTDPAYDSYVELVAAIDARTGWTATRLLTHSSFDYSDTLMRPWNSDGDGATSEGVCDFDAVTVGADAVTIYMCTTLHSDVLHAWQANWINQMISDIYAINRHDHPGAKRGVQGCNFEAAYEGEYGYHDGLAILNVADVQWTNAAANGRTAFGSLRTNVIVAFSTFLRAPFNMNYNGSGQLNRIETDYVPINNIFAYSVFTDLGIEGSSPTDVDNGDNIYFYNNQNAAGGRLSDLDSASTTVADESTLFANYDPDNPDENNISIVPAASGGLVNRGPSGQTWRNLGDIFGTVRGDTPSVGAVEYTLIVSSGNASSTTVAGQFIITKSIHKKIFNNQIF